MRGIVGYGAYLPHHRLDRELIRSALTAGGGRGTRTVASYDEDTTSMGVEAARLALHGLADRRSIRALFFATATPSYADKTNATAIHAALRLAPETLAIDVGGAVRSGVGALVAVAQSTVPALAVLADIRTGLPGGADESDGGDGAAAFVFADDTFQPVVAELLTVTASTAEFLERWRTPGADHSSTWEERFGEQAYVPLIDAAVTDALKQTSMTVDHIDHLVVAGLHRRATKRVAGIVGVRVEAVVDDLSNHIGNAGTAQAGILLADVLDRASAGETIAVVVLGDGVTVLMLRTTAAIERLESNNTVAAQLCSGTTTLPYATFLSWRGFLDREPPRRPEPEAPAAPPAQRRTAWKFALVADRCTVCGTRSMPPARVCLKCHAIDEMAAEPMADVPGTVTTYTVDRLAYTPSPPILVVVVDFAGGGRLRCQLTDATESDVRIGLPVEMTFRRLVTAGGVHNYFWKARPSRVAS